MKINKKLLLIITVIMTMAVLSACGKSTASGMDKNSLEGIKEKGKLVVGTSADYPPYEFTILVDGKEEVVGFDMAMAKYIADELGVELEIQDMDFKNLLGAIPSGKVDMVIAGMSPDPERAKEVNFSEIYYNATHGVLIKKDSEASISKEEDLIGKKIGAQMGTVQEELANSIENAEVKSLGLTTNLLMELKTDKINAIIMEKPVAEAYAEANEDLMLVENIEYTAGGEGSAIAMKKDNNSLTDKVNEILKTIKEEELMEEWVIEAQKHQEMLNN